MQEAEMERIVVPGQPGQESLQDLISMGKCLAWVYVPVIPEMVEI
jgi:hypothetical protein